MYAGAVYVAAGSSSNTIGITINADNVDEGLETFAVNISPHFGVVIADAQGIGQIVSASTPFRFRTVDLYSSVTTIPYVFTGYRNGDTVFTVTRLHFREGS